MSTPPSAPIAEAFPKPLQDPEQLREQAEEAANELMENASEYGDLIKAIREKKPIGDIVKEFGEAAVEGQRDLHVLIPAIQNTTRALKDGVSTSEFQMFSAVNKVLTIIAILAPVIEGSLAAYRSSLGEDASMGGSLVITGISVFLKTFISDRYNKGRVIIKQQAAQLPFEVEEVDG